MRGTSSTTVRWVRRVSFWFLNIFYRVHRYVRFVTFSKFGTRPEVARAANGWVGGRRAGRPHYRPVTAARAGRYTVSLVSSLVFRLSLSSDPLSPFFFYGFFCFTLTDSERVACRRDAGRWHVPGTSVHFDIPGAPRKRTERPVGFCGTSGSRFRGNRVISFG